MSTTVATRVRRTQASGGAWPARDLTDSGNADRLVDRYADRLRYVGDNAKWAVYDGQTGLWRLRGADHQAKGLMRKVFEDMRDCEGPSHTGDAGKDFLSFVRRCGSATALKNAMSIATTKRGVAADVGDFNANEHALHCANGVLDLDTLTLMDHSPKHMMTRSTGVAYRPGARSPAWTGFLRTFLPDKALRSWMQLLFGLSLVSGNPEKLLLMVKGEGNAGKSSLNELVSAALGGGGARSYAQSIELSFFKGVQDGTKGNVPLANALPARYVAATEAGSGWTLHTDQIKRLTGNDMMSARYLNDNATVERRPGFTPWIFTNEIPKVNGRDSAFMDRLMVIPMNTVPPVVRRGKTAAMLEDPSVLEAVLAWMVQGLERYRASGLPSREGWPAVVLAETAAAVKNMSITDAWISENCLVGPEYKILDTVLYENYRSWCMFNEIGPADMFNKIQFGRHLGGLKIHADNRKVRSGGVRRSVRYYFGIDLS